jgi:hypothetical protein
VISGNKPVFSFYGINTNVNTAYNFAPARRKAILFHSLAILVLAALGSFGIWQANQAEIGLTFLLSLVPSLIAILLIPMLIYRLYALRQAGYVLHRDGFRLGWGLRVEDIPMDRVNWVRPANQVEGHLPLPLIRWPGSILGIRHLPNGEVVEFMASEQESMILIATPGRIFVISPEQPEAFLQAYQRFNEYGSLASIEARSVYPAFLLARVWADRAARYLILPGILLGLVLFILVSLAVPGLREVALMPTFNAAGLDLVPAIQLFLLPVLVAIFVTIDLIGGLFFYRKAERKPLAFVLWGSADFSALLFLFAVFFILKAA